MARNTRSFRTRSKTTGTRRTPYTNQSTNQPCRLYGSAFPRVIPFSLFSAGFTAILFYFPGADYFSKICGHPYVFYNLSFIIRFILVFRSNFAYARFVSGRVNLQSMSGRWAYACSTALAFEAADTAMRLGRDAGNYERSDEYFDDGFAFDPRTIDPQKYTAAMRRYEGFKTQLLHKFSLLHALCLQHLRVDWRLSNLAPHVPDQEPPPEDAAALLDRKFDIRQYFALPASAELGLSYAEISPLVVIPGFSTQDTGANQVIKGGAVTEDELYSLGYRFEAFAERQFETTFGGIELRKLTSDRRPSVDGDVASYDGGDMMVDNDTASTLSGVSPRSLHVSPTEVSVEEPKSPRIRQNVSLFGQIFQQQTGLFVIGAQERVYTAFAWVQSMLAQRSSPSRGWKAIEPPTGMAAWRGLDEGFEAFEQCRALVDTPFPFPWAQAMVLFLVIFSLCLPLLMVAWLKTVWIACLVDFLSVFCFWTLNEVARDLESPFVFPPNDLPLARMQYNFNERIIASAAASFEETILKYHDEYHTKPTVIRKTPFQGFY